MSKKFIFSPEFQLELLKFSVQDTKGKLVIELYNDSYFTLLEHSVIAFAIKRFYKRRFKAPSKPLLIEELGETFGLRDFAESLTTEDRKDILKIGKSLYKGHIEDHEDIMEKVEHFFQYVALKGLIENTDINDYSQYERFVEKAQKAVSNKLKTEADRGTFLIKDIEQRQMERQDDTGVLPTPFRQFNSATNAGGYERNSVIVVLDKPKQFKSGFMVNVAKGYMRMKKKIILFDLENGENSLATRFEQSLTKRTKSEILSGDYDKDVKKVLRKYKRLGSEIYIKRLPAFSKASDMKKELIFIKDEFGIEFNIMIVDYIGLMNSMSGKSDDHSRIADAYLDISNLGHEFGFEHIWTPHHVKNDAYVREKSKYKENDLAKSIEIGRHVQAMWGLNRSEEEKEGNILRAEIIAQRDGIPNGRALFQVDMATQHIEEFNKEQRVKYNEVFGDPSVEVEEPNKFGRKPKKTKPNGHKEDLD